MPTTPDLTTPSVVLRIVLFGASGAGTTSTVHALRNGLGQGVVAADGDHPGPFDWMEYLGGRHDGQPILTQLIGVTGTDAARRRAMLAGVDVVVFVADSSEAGLDATVAAHDELRRLLDDLGSTAAVVVQANHRDRPDALDVRVLRDALGLAPGDQVVETIASRGEGVRQAFIFAVRSGLERVKASQAAAYGAATSPTELADLLDRAATEQPPPGTSLAADPPDQADGYQGPERRRSTTPLDDTDTGIDTELTPDQWADADPEQWADTGTDVDTELTADQWAEPGTGTDRPAWASPAASDPPSRPVTGPATPPAPVDSPASALVVPALAPAPAPAPAPTGGHRDGSLAPPPDRRDQGPLPPAGGVAAPGPRRAPDDPATLNDWPRIVDRPRDRAARATAAQRPTPPPPPPPGPSRPRRGDTAPPQAAPPAPPRTPATPVDDGGTSPLARWWRALWESK